MAHYFHAEPAVASQPRATVLELPDLHLAMTTDRGVFSYGEVDLGTRLLLLESPVPPDGGHLLDLGCGFGPVAVTLAHRAPRATVWALDVNRRALELTTANAAAAGVGDRVHAVTDDQVSDDLRFDGIWSNPPIRVGKAVLHPLLERWLDRLAPAARAWLVVHQHLGADSLARHLNEVGYGVERVCARQGYRVLAVSPRVGGAR